eukprot:jgi/Mesvir1/7421/Mv19204-RA.1
MRRLQCFYLLLAAAGTLFTLASLLRFAADTTYDSSYSDSFFSAGQNCSCPCARELLSPDWCARWGTHPSARSPEALAASLRKIQEPSKVVGSSIRYWEERYHKNKRSGDGRRLSGDGSYGVLAQFKAEVLNDFVERNRVRSVLELGFGDGNQLTLARYPRYLGFDVSSSALAIASAKFAHDPWVSLAVYDGTAAGLRGAQAEMAMSLDVLYHLVEESIFNEYLGALFGAATRFVVIYAGNVDRQTAPHVVLREFVLAIEKHPGARGWHLLTTLRNRYPQKSFADFFIYGTNCTSA